MIPLPSHTKTFVETSVCVCVWGGGGGGVSICDLPFFGEYVLFVFFHRTFSQVLTTHRSFNTQKLTDTLRQTPTPFSVFPVHQGEGSGQPNTPEFRSCVKVEVALLGLPVPNSPYGLCGRKATLYLNNSSELKSCVKVEVAVLGSLSLIIPTVSMDVMQH